LNWNIYQQYPITIKINYWPFTLWQLMDCRHKIVLSISSSSNIKDLRSRKLFLNKFILKDRCTQCQISVTDCTKVFVLRNAKIESTFYLELILVKALRKTEFRNCSVLKIQKFFGKTWFFGFAKISQKNFGNKFGNENSEINLNIIQICMSNTKLSNKTT